MLTNERTLLTVFVTGKGSRKMLPEFLERTERLLHRLGIPPKAIEAEQNEMQEIVLLPTASRRTLGNLTDIGHAIRHHVQVKYPSYEEIDWDREEMIFTERIYSSLYETPMNLVYPRDLVREILS